MEKRKILITGGAGFIGSNIAANELAKGHDVWVVDSLITGQLGNIQPYLKNPAFRFDQADISTWAKMPQAVSWADRIFHMAATVGQKYVLKHPVYTITNNIDGTEAIFKAMADTKTRARLVIASTSELYCHSKENPDGTVSETAEITMNTKVFQQATYPVGKLVNEVMGLSYAFEKGIHMTIARIFNTIGMNQSPAYGMVVPNFIDQALSQQPLTVYGDGLQSRSFIDARDTAVALDLLLDHPESSSEIYNVGQSKECNILDLARLIIKKTGSTSTIRYVSYEEAYFGLPFIDVRRRQPDTRKINKLTGFTPRWTLDDTIEMILQEKLNKQGCKCV
ncbi:MAG: NAD-dependent epimerase/dehydratase family protein [Parachlamydiaceae bacterium]